MTCLTTKRIPPSFGDPSLFLSFISRIRNRWFNVCDVIVASTVWGHEVQGAGTIAVNNLGGFLSMDVFATLKYYCGVTGEGLLAEVRAETNKEVSIGDDFFVLSDLAISANFLQQKNATKYATGTVSGVASIPGAIPGLWIAASVSFDTSDMSATVLIQASYTNDYVVIEAVGSFTINLCTPTVGLIGFSSACLHVEC